ncbi:MAG TPA: hypothetical protein V6C81_11950 [Planktothrix sp.]|jgi:hypothetical protein
MSKHVQRPSGVAPPTAAEIEAAAKKVGVKTYSEDLVRDLHDYAHGGRLHTPSDYLPQAREEARRIMTDRNFKNEHKLPLPDLEQELTNNALWHHRSMGDFITGVDLGWFPGETPVEQTMQMLKLLQQMNKNTRSDSAERRFDRNDAREVSDVQRQVDKLSPEERKLIKPKKGIKSPFKLDLGRKKEDPDGKEAAQSSKPGNQKGKDGAATSDPAGNQSGRGKAGNSGDATPGGSKPGGEQPGSRPSDKQNSEKSATSSGEKQEKEEKPTDSSAERQDGKDGSSSSEQGEKRGSKPGEKKDGKNNSSSAQKQGKPRAQSGDKQQGAKQSGRKKDGAEPQSQSGEKKNGSSSPSEQDEEQSSAEEEQQAGQQSGENDQDADQQGDSSASESSAAEGADCEGQPQDGGGGGQDDDNDDQSHSDSSEEEPESATGADENNDDSQSSDSDTANKPEEPEDKDAMSNQKGKAQDEEPEPTEEEQDGSDSGSPQSGSAHSRLQGRSISQDSDRMEIAEGLLPGGKLRMMLDMSRQLDMFESVKITKRQGTTPDPEGEDVRRRRMKDISEFGRIVPAELSVRTVSRSYFRYRLATHKVVIRERIKHFQRKQIIFILLDGSGSMGGAKHWRASGVVMNRLKAVLAGDAELWLSVFDIQLTKVHHAATEAQALDVMEKFMAGNYTGGGTNIGGSVLAAHRHIQNLMTTRDDLERPQIWVLTDEDTSISHITPAQVEGTKVNAMVFAAANKALCDFAKATGGLAFEGV